MREPEIEVAVLCAKETHAYLSYPISGKNLYSKPPPEGGVLSYMGYIGMCGPKGYGFSAVLVINRVSIFAL